MEQPKRRPPPDVFDKIMLPLVFLAFGFVVFWPVCVNIVGSLVSDTAIALYVVLGLFAVVALGIIINGIAWAKKNP